MKDYRGIRTGLSPEENPLYYRGPGGLILVGPARSGKARDILTTAILDWPYSLVGADSKGELASLTDRRRQQFGDVHYLDPYRVLSEFLPCAKPSHYNPMSRLNPLAPDFVAHADKTGEGLIADEGKDDIHNHFTLGARGAVAGLQMGLALHHVPEERNLSAVRSIITGAFEGLDVFSFAAKMMVESQHLALRKRLAKFCVRKPTESKSLADIIQTCDVQTQFLDDPAVAETLSASDFSFADLKKRVGTVYIVTPLTFASDSKYTRVVIASALSELLSTPRGVPVLIILDEFCNLGKLSAVQAAMSMAAGLGVQLWPVIQDLDQLAGVYENWRTFLANAGVQIFLPPRDEKTSQYLSGLCGQGERRRLSKNISYPNEAEHDDGERQTPKGIKRPATRPVSRPAQINFGFTSTPRPLLSPDEARALGDDEMILMVDSVKAPIRAKRRPYWEEKDLEGTWGQNPYEETKDHEET